MFNAQQGGDVLFVNYGQLDDYRLLQSAYNITRDTIEGKIVIAKQFQLTADEQVCHSTLFACCVYYTTAKREVSL